MDSLVFSRRMGKRRTLWDADQGAASPVVCLNPKVFFIVGTRTCRNTARPLGGVTRPAGGRVSRVSWAGAGGAGGRPGGGASPENPLLCSCLNDSEVQTAVWGAWLLGVPLPLCGGLMRCARGGGALTGSRSAPGPPETRVSPSARWCPPWASHAGNRWGKTVHLRRVVFDLI